nr:beta-galactosidase [Micromonospora sp. DSM 115978]
MPNLIVPAAAPDPLAGHLRMGEPASRPDAIGATSRYLTRGGRPWLPVMGEFHFARYPAAEWPEELRKIRAGGITVVATYLFWIMHEEERGRFDWSGDRDLRRFVSSCADAGLDVVARIGPWAHGECRNGGFPDWLLAAGVAARTDDPGYLDLVRRYLAQIGEQLRGLDRASGGPVVGIQVENELYDQPEHLVTLKRLAREAGLDAPLWTATGWGHARLPADEVIPLYGGYPEAAWDTAHDGWPRQSRAHYFFGPGRDDDSIGADLRTADRGADQDESHLARYPFATCELGGGMYTSYHRRPIVDADDVAALALVKLGSGSVWQGYYLYHGGSMKIGARSTLQESHATGYPNDCPVITYDFQAPLGEYGQFRESFAALRTQHLWLAARGSELAAMPPHFPDDAPRDPADRATLRWSVRAAGDAGYLFVNNHQPVEGLPDRHGVRFTVDLGGRTLTVPHRPVTIRAGAYFVWPLNQRIGGIRLRTASAQPVTELVVAGVPTAVLARTAGIPVELALDAAGVGGVDGPGTVSRTTDGALLVTDLTPGPDCRLRITRPDGGGLADVIVLDETDARRITRGRLWGADRLVLSEAPVVLAGDRPVVYGGGGDLLAYPPAGPPARGVFSAHPTGARPTPVPATPRPVRPAAPARRPRVDPATGRASAPVDEDFAAAAVYHVPVPADLFDGGAEVLLRVRWIGDVGRAYLDGVLVADQFWYGPDWEIGLRRFRERAIAYGVELRLLPLAADAPIHLSARVRPVSCPADGLLDLRGVEFVPVPRRVLDPPSIGRHP